MAQIDDADTAIAEVTNNGYYLEATDDGILMVADEEKIAHLRAAGSAAVILAEDVEARHGDDCELAIMYRTANDFVQDVARFSQLDADEDGTLPAARGRFADIVLLHAAIGLDDTHTDLENVERSGASGSHAALHFLTQLYDRAYRQLKFRDVGGRMEAVDHDYGRV